MSGSPTAAAIRLRQEEERRLAEVRRRLAEQERRLREEAERRARVDLANRLHAELVGEVERLKSNLTELRVSAAESRFAWVPHLEPEIEAAVAGAGSVPESIAAALGKIRATASRVAALRSTIRQQAAAIASMQDEIRKEATAEAARLAAALRSEEAEREQLVITLVTELRARIAGIEADVIAMAWSRDEISSVAAAIETIREATDPEEQARALLIRLDTALALAQTRQLAEERRAYIVAALQDGLREQGFQVSSATLVGDHAESEVAFRAVRADRRWVDVNVPLVGHVFYDVDGTDRITERGADGLMYTSCDETESRLEALHADLNRRFGLEAGELFWESKDPHRQQRNANALPAGGPANTRKRG